MVKTVASSQVLNSQASYLTALADADRIGQAIDLSMNGKKVVGLDQYITRFSNLSMQRQIRQELGINPTLKALHERLDTALENLSGRVVSVASKMSLDAANQASKAASLARQQNTSKPWTWRQRITYGTIGGLAAGFVIYYPVMTWNLFINTPRAAKTAYHTSDEFLKTAPGTVAAGATVIGGFATGLGALIGKTRQGASAAGIDVPPPPTTLEAKMGTGFSLIANHLLCTTVASRVSPIFSLVTNRAGFLPSANTFCTMTTALEAIRPNTTEPALQWIGEQASSAGQKLAAWL
ncbi:MAG: hypothetical protein FJZ64_02675, partial [Chlamydiae bacterium]|nr:hypothetical protein [Chlamydiota bacterium]